MPSCRISCTPMTVPNRHSTIRKTSVDGAKIEGCRASAAVRVTAGDGGAGQVSHRHNSTGGGRTAPLSHGAAGLPMVLTGCDRMAIGLPVRASEDVNAPGMNFLGQ